MIILIEDFVEATMQRHEDSIKKSKEILIKTVSNSISNLSTNRKIVRQKMNLFKQQQKKTKKKLKKKKKKKQIKK